MNMHKLCFDYFISLDTNGEAKEPKTARGTQCRESVFPAKHQKSFTTTGML